MGPTSVSDCWKYVGAVGPMLKLAWTQLYIIRLRSEDLVQIPVVFIPSTDCWALIIVEFSWVWRRWVFSLCVSNETFARTVFSLHWTWFVPKPHNISLDLVRSPGHVRLHTSAASHCSGIYTESVCVFVKHLWLHLQLLQSTHNHTLMWQIDFKALCLKCKPKPKRSVNTWNSLTVQTFPPNNKSVIIRFLEDMSDFLSNII